MDVVYWHRSMLISIKTEKATPAVKPRTNPLRINHHFLTPMPKTAGNVRGVKSDDMDGETFTAASLSDGQPKQVDHGQQAVR